MNVPLKTKIDAAKTGLGKEDPAVAVLEGIGGSLDSMEKSIHNLTAKVVVIQETGMILRIGRIRNFLFSFITGTVLGVAGTWYWMSGHGFMGGFWAHGIKVHTVENREQLQLKISGDNIDSYDYIKDQNGKVIGFWVDYRKESQP